MINLINKLVKKRILCFIILFLILAGLCVYYYDNYSYHEKYPTKGTIIKNYPEEQLVSVSGTITQTYNNGFYVEDIYNGKKVYYKIYSSTKVNSGDKVEVIGILRPDYQINAKQITITPNWSYQFVLIRSFIAFLVLAFIFRLYWRFDFTGKEFVRRK